MKIFKSLFPLTAAIMLACTVSHAADVTLSWAKKGALDVTARVTAPNGCYYTGEASAGFPEGVPNIDNTIAITLPVESEGDLCSQEIKTLEYNLSIPGVPEGITTVIVYEIWRQDEALKAAAYPLPAHKHK